MQEEIIQTGKTVEDAIEAACLKLGCEREGCVWEIIDLPKKGFLGIKNTPARVKVTVERREPERPKKQEPRQPQAQPVRESAPKEREARPVRKPEPARRDRTPPPPAPAFAPTERKISLEAPSEELKGKAEVSKDYLVSMLDAMQLKSCKIDTVWEDGGVYFSVNGDGLGQIIGRRGETLDSLQYLCGLVANRQDGEYLRVTVDCGDYRVKRRSTLEALARKLSEQVLRTDTSRTLEPMNPFERRIIHSTVSTIEGVSSTSVGEEPGRRVIITSPTAKTPKRGARPPARFPENGGRDRPERPAPSGERRSAPASGGPARDRDHPRPAGGGRSGGRPNRSGGGFREKEKFSGEIKPVAPPQNPPREAENKPLYGKIELD
ncbi:MAG: Jag N-terminal domain-containing protein [Oscillospiraceae bacterium]|jgi:spoIIIJ-associated protein|nr:Jag N-terminal domain-containing protein [Oscillospiraceae bacterium]